MIVTLERPTSRPYGILEVPLDSIREMLGRL